MISVAELMMDNQEFEETRWVWKHPGYEIESCDFTEDGSFKWYNFKHYCELWADKLNEDEDTDRYIVAYKSAGYSKVSRLTVVKLKEDSDDEESSSI